MAGVLAARLHQPSGKRGPSADKTHPSRAMGDEAETAVLLKPHAWVLLTRQVHHTLYAPSAHDQLVAAHIASLDHILPAHLGNARGHLWAWALERHATWVWARGYASCEIP